VTKKERFVTLTPVVAVVVVVVVVKVAGVGDDAVDVVLLLRRLVVKVSSVGVVRVEQET
jgi:hypothetical protein